MRKKNGFVLIFSLWVLGFLTVLAVSVASGIRQKIILVQKLDERSRMHYLVEAAAAQTKTYIRRQLDLSQYATTLLLKMGLHNNPDVFAQIFLGSDQAQVSYTLYDGDSMAMRFGVVDEERKLNINTCNTIMLQRLLERVLGARPQEALALTNAILDWRKFGESAITGFFSDDYYTNLQYPYPKKDAAYEVLDELLLVKGMTKEVYERILPYVTIYGDGKVNINTAPGPVLYALGLEDAVIDKILAVRRGQDSIEATLDDHVFSKTFDIASEVNAAVRLGTQEIRAIDALNLQGLLTANSYYFTMDIRAQLARTAWSKDVQVVFSSRENRILYWRAK